MTRRSSTPRPLQPELTSSGLSPRSIPSPKTPPDGSSYSSIQSPVPRATTIGSPNQALPPQTPILNPLTSPPSNPVSPLTGMHLLYSCTYGPRCFESFNTYDEWASHEETAHAPPAEVFFCGERYDDGFGVERCNAGFRSRGEFEQHLQQTHEIVGASDSELDRHAVGPRTRKFWCGFCTKVVDLPAGDSGGDEVWAMKRFTHIEEHYLGRNGPRMLIAKWVSIFMVAI